MFLLVSQTDEELFELFKDWKLISSTEDFQSIMKNKKARDQLYGYVESKGGARKVRQSIRPKQPPPPPVVSKVLIRLQSNYTQGQIFIKNLVLTCQCPFGFTLYRFSIIMCPCVRFDCNILLEIIEILSDIHR